MTTCYLVAGFACLLVCAANVNAGAKQPAPKVTASTASPEPAASADTRPTLEVTMKFAHDKITEQHNISFTEEFSEGKAPGKITGWSNYIGVAPDLCSFTGNKFLGGEKGETETGGFQEIVSLRDVQSVKVVNLIDVLAERWVAGGYSGGGPIQETPSLYVLQLDLGGTKKHSMLFADHSLADRVAKALARAVELCGAAANEPF